METTARSSLLGRVWGPGAAALALALTLGAAPAVAVDSDGDGFDDAIDTCRELSHPHLGDADGDGFGDPCDCDFDGNGSCSVDDFSLLLPDLIAGVDSGVGSDMNGDGGVNVNDFTLFVRGFMAGAPGPGATGGGDPAAAFPGVTCEGSLDSDLCSIQITPSIVLEALRSQLAIEVSDLSVTGAIRLPTLDGQVWLLESELTIVTGDGPFGFETVRGSAVLRNELGGLLEDVDVTGLMVDVGMDLGANIVADVPLAPDLHYLFFMAQAGLLIDLGPFTIEGPGVSTTLLFNPGDPFFYAGGAVENIPIPTPAGVFVLSAGAGVGFSSQGLIPFEPNTSEGIAALFPSFDGHMVNQASGELPTCPGCPTLTFAGYAITDLDPQEDGELALFGPGADLALGINGDFGVEGSLGLLSIQVDLFGATGGFEATQDDFVWFAGGRIGSEPDLFLLDVASDFELLPPSAGELGLGVLVSANDPSMSFFRFEGQGMTVGPTGIEAATGVAVASFSTAEFFFQTGGAGTFLGGSTTAQDIVQGVRALDESSWSLSFPSDDVPELILFSRYQIGEHQLEQSTIWISPVRVAQEGIYVLPSHRVTMYGEITRDGPLHRGTLEVPIPYSYPEVATLLQLADLISQQEAEVAQAEQIAGDAADALAAAQQALAAAQSAANVAYDAFDAADDALQANLDEIDEWYAVDCGCDDCQVWNVVCWTACGACEATKWGAIELLELATPGLQDALDIAQAAWLAAQGALGTAQTRLTLAQQTLTAANLALGDALAALSALYHQRDTLPPEDGVFDAILELTLTDTDMIGSVSGDFQGVPVGTSAVYLDEGTPRACFTPPVPGATEEFCTPL